MLMRRRQGFVNRLRIFVFLLISCVTLSEFFPVLVPGAHAQSVSYAYDADGRLSAVSDGSNNVAGYQYDQLGNILGISRGTGVGFDVVPFAGTVNTQVAIYGIGFSATLNQNVVKFNGTTATVLSGTPATNPTQLLVDVPSGASTGPISVTSPSGSSTGTASFKVN